MSTMQPADRKQVMMDEEPTLLTDVLVELAAVTTEPFDVSELMHLATERACELLASDGAVVLLSVDGVTMAAAGSAGTVGDVDALLAEEGVPCRQAMQTGHHVRYARERGNEQFPAYTHLAAEAGINRVLSVPLRNRDGVFGTLSMVRLRPIDYTEAEVDAAHRVADVVAASFVREQAHRAALATSAQLQHALEARVVIEQAKGMVAAELQVTIEEALDSVRRYARSHQVRLADVAERIVDRTLAITELKKR